MRIKSAIVMMIRNTTIENTYAEAFTMYASRLIVTAIDNRWAQIAATEASGYGTSIIGCDAEAAIERHIEPSQTPDGRPGVAILLFARHRDTLMDAVSNRIGQCLLTCPTTAVFDGIGDAKQSENTTPFDAGQAVSLFGDGYQKKTTPHGKQCWQIPVMDGWFVVEETMACVSAIGGGNFLICGTDQAVTLQAASRAVEAIAEHPGVITPFPGGVVRSGSKVGSSNPNVTASTNDAYCPALRDQATSKLHRDTDCVYEIVIDGLTQQAIIEAMRIGIAAACGNGIVAISAGNYNGKLGSIDFQLHEIMADVS